MFYHKFGLKINPFTITPDPKFLLLTEKHGEVLGNLIYAMQNHGITIVTGEVGTGKTTLLRAFFEQVPESIHLIYILNQVVTPEELLLSVCDELKIQIPENRTNSVKLMVNEINNVLLSLNAQGKRAILIIDEAQNLSVSCIESIRLLTNLEKNEAKLLNIILVGQQELNETLKKKEMRQVKSRIVSNNYLTTLNLHEVKNYISYRLNVAGCQYSIFDDKCTKLIYKASKGMPRTINIICEKSLIIAYSQDTTKMSSMIVNKAIEIVNQNFNTPSNISNHLFTSISVVFLLMITVSIYLSLFEPKLIQKITLDYLGLDIGKYLVAEDNITSNKEKLNKNKTQESKLKSVENLYKNKVIIQRGKDEVVIDANKIETKQNVTDNASENEIKNKSAASAQTILFNRYTSFYLDKKNITKILNNINLNSIPLDNTLSFCQNIEWHGHQCFTLNYNFNDWYKKQFFSILELKNKKYIILDKYIYKNSLEYFYIQHNWKNKVISIMKAPTGFNHLIKIGDQGENVNWVYQQIKDLPVDRNKLKEIKNSYLYDEKFEAVVKNAQQILRVIPDGDFGVDTLLNLNIYKNHIYLFTDDIN